MRANNRTTPSKWCDFYQFKDLTYSSNNNPKDICTLSSVVEHGAYDAAAMGSIPIGCTKSYKCGFNSTMSF